MKKQDSIDWREIDIAKGIWQDMEKIEQDYLDFVDKVDAVKKTTKNWKSIKKKLWTEEGFAICEKRREKPELIAKAKQHHESCERFAKDLGELFGWLALCNKDEHVLRVAQIIKTKITDLQTAVTIHEQEESKK